MKTDDLDKSIEQLEKQIQYLQHDYILQFNRHDALISLRTIRIQLKQAEESLRLKKRIRSLFLY